jgi:HEPN domain-containing protein
MDAQEKYGYWLETAQYDLDTADAMFQSGRWVYVVFMCQQAIEKLVKGLYVLYIDDNVPKTHNIRILVERFESQLQEPVTDERYNLFEDLTIHYINGRYTDYKQSLNERLDKQTAADFIKQTKEVFAWLLTMKP